MDCRNTQITDGLLASYREIGGINHIDRSHLPSKRDVAKLCEDLLRILFPGFLEDDPIDSDQIGELTATRVKTIIDRLRREILRSPSQSDCKDSANELCCDFLQQLPEVRRLLQTDVEAAYEGDPAATSFEEIILSYPCIEAIAIQRCAHLLYQAKLSVIPRIMTEWAHSRTGIDIHPGAQIGSHFFIDHGTGVVIGETCVIGSRVKLYHGVTLGARSFVKDEEGNIVKGTKRHPNVEDGVTIYPNAAILGGETIIGARSTIGANVFLMESIPPDSLVVYEEGGKKVLDKNGHK
jgi:serine O-acetyltransferase